MRRALFSGVLALAALGAVARAETVADEAVALGWQTEHADAVVVASIARMGEMTVESNGDTAVEMTVLESIRGDLAAGASSVVLVPDLAMGKPWTDGARRLAFLRALAVPQGAPPRFGLVSGAFGVRALPAEGPEARFPGIVRQIAATLGQGGTVRDRDTLRELLVGWMEDPDPGIAWSAATDFVRHRELHEGLGAEQRARIVAAFRRQPVGKATKEVLALAAAATRDPAAAVALADSLLDPRARLVRGAVAEALRRLRDPRTTELLVARFEGAGAAHRATLLDVLGVVGAGPAAPVARAHLSDPEPDVRIEAAHALGRIARNVREDDPPARVEGRRELAALLAAAKTDGELKAALWALAQLDDPEAFALLREAAARDPRELVRRFAERYLARPRQSFVP